jgi:dihydrofolate reductase
LVSIVAVDENWGIGYKGELLFKIPEDMKFFRSLTENKVVVMGHATFKSLPGARPLKNRINIILSKDKGLKIESVIVCNSTEQLFDAVSAYPSDDVFVIGGQEIYNQLFDYCSTIYITKVESLKQADRHFPNIDLKHNWKLQSESEKKEYEGLKYTFNKYINCKAKSMGANNVE